MLRPYFSIIIPCYNQGNYLSEAIVSVLNQEFIDWEIIVVNDGSTDSTKVVAESFCVANSRIKLLNQVNGGLSSARNAGIRAARGLFLQFLDADDLLLKGCLLEVQREIERSDKRAQLIRIGYTHVNESNTKEIHHVIPGRLDTLIPFALNHNLGPPHSLFINSNMARCLGNFDETLKSAEDWDFWMRAAKAGVQLITLPKVLVAYRYVQNSMSRDAFRMYEALKTVALRAPWKDHRILIHSTANADYNIYVSDIIKKQLLMCMGVSIMQGKIHDSVRFFKVEKEHLDFEISHKDFSVMYSYLSFRYWTSQNEIEQIFSELYPRFELFFESIGLSVAMKRKALFSVFLPVYKLKNHHRFGRIVGGLINKMAFYNAYL